MNFITKVKCILKDILPVFHFLIFFYFSNPLFNFPALVNSTRKNVVMSFHLGSIFEAFRSLISIIV